ncbi:MAG: DUF551 domain-containing protein [Clostridia bacterium]|nr:DUF551 domain-containing protein [Clostridia bacterium]
MPDLEKVISRLENWIKSCPFEKCYHCGERGKCTNLIFEDVLSLLKMQRWIPATVLLPATAGEYLVAYHPCYWDDVNTSVIKVGVDNFRGRTTWAKKKYQRVIVWMPLPEPPKEES